MHDQIPLSVDLQAALDCCCLTLQQLNLWNLLASAANVTYACSLINCIRFIIEAGEYYFNSYEKIFLINHKSSLMKFQMPGILLLSPFLIILLSDLFLLLLISHLKLCVYF